jgi:cation diffusion facilitator family transporter
MASRRRTTRNSTAEATTAAEQTNAAEEEHTGTKRPSSPASTKSTHRAVHPTPFLNDSTTADHTLSPPVPVSSQHSAVPASVQMHLLLAMRLSLLINFLLFSFKTYSALVSKSLSVGASAGESCLDLASEGIVVWAERKSKVYDRRMYPIGRAKLEPIGIILTSSLMAFGALQLIMESTTQLFRGWTHAGRTGAEQDSLDGLGLHAHSFRFVTFDAFTITLLTLNIVAKMGLWIYCRALAKYSPTLYTLSLDHRNDVLSNLVALLSALLSWLSPSLWFLDACGAVLMSLWIALNWFGVGREQVEKIVGRTADGEAREGFREAVERALPPSCTLDVLTAYSAGTKFIVELELLVPPEMSVRDSTRVSKGLQRAMEQMETVERCFVLVDHQPAKGRDRHERTEEQPATEQ